MELILRFAESFGLALALAFGLRLVAERFGPRWPLLSQAVRGLLFGLLAVLFMNLPLEVQPGVLIDLRNLAVFLAGPFGGPLAALVAGVVGGGFRLYLGGAGALAGTGGILTAAALGAVIAQKYGPLANIKTAALAGLALFLVCMPWFLVIGDLALGWQLLQRFSLAYLAFYVGGTVVMSTLLMSDIRHRRAERSVAFSEQRFRDIAEMASDWFWEMDADLRVTYVSSRLCEITGYSVEEFRGKRRLDLIAQVSHAELRAHEETLRLRKPFRNFSYAIRTKEGPPRQVVTSGKPVFDPDGRFIGYRGSGRDVTAETRYRRELEAARLSAELANKAKSDFLAAMSHELRTPLNAIIGFAEIMQKELFGRHTVASYKGYSADIHNSALYLLSLVNDVLDVARVESGRVKLERSACDLPEIVASALRLLEERATRRGIRLTSDIQPGMPSAYLDERLIKQVLVNLTTNAVKFTKAGGRIQVTAQFDAEEGFRISVSDSGIGIAAEELAEVLKPFQQASNARQASQEGTGLGLPLSKALVEAHGGSLSLQSDLGSGTTVTVVLPPAASLAPGASRGRDDIPLAC